MAILWLGAVAAMAPEAMAQNIPSLSKLTPAQQTQQMAGVAAYNRGDWAVAAALFEPLAALGDARSETDLGTLYDRGWGVKQDRGRALELQNAAAAQEEPDAEYYMGLAYETGHGVARDDVAALKFYGLAARHGESLSMCEIGTIFRDGLGVARNYGAAMAAYQAAAGAANAWLLAHEPG